jgi:hypothetical protein
MLIAVKRQFLFVALWGITGLRSTLSSLYRPSLRAAAAG